MSVPTSYVTWCDFTIPGPVTGKGRPRAAMQGNRIVMRTPSATRTAEAVIVDAWARAGSPRLPDGPVEAWIIVEMARPKRHYKTDGTLSAAGLRSLAPTRKPDLDNAAKLVCDALNGRVYADDAHIVALHVRKRWAQDGVERVFFTASGGSSCRG